MHLSDSGHALTALSICIHRQDDDTNFRTLYSLAVRMAQLIGLDEDTEESYSTFDIQMRRRLWWHICGLESRSAEEGTYRNASIMTDRQIPLPANLNDTDLDPQASVTPKSRSGYTQMIFPLLRFEIFRNWSKIWAIRREQIRAVKDQAQSVTLKDDQENFLSTMTARLKSRFLTYLDDSRPFDWLCKTFTLGMLVSSGASPIFNHPSK